MSIVGGFDVHRQQVTFDYLDTDTGVVRTGRISPACRAQLRAWLRRRFAGRADVTFVVEGCTGWRFIAEELARAGIGVQVAEPAETANLRGPKRRAKTDKTDAAHLRTLLAQDRVPRSWVPPEGVLEARAVLALYADLREEHTAWGQRIHATLFHLGVPAAAGRLGDAAARTRLRTDPAGVGLSPAGAQAVTVALDRVQELEPVLDQVHRQIAVFARRHPACRALQAQHGVGPLGAVALWAYLGDARRFSSSAKAVRYCGLDVTVYSSDGKRLSHGHLSKQGPPILRWVLFEDALHAARTTSPDHDYYRRVAERIDTDRAGLSQARRLVRRAHHILRGLGDQAFTAPIRITDPAGATPAAA